MTKVFLQLGGARPKANVTAPDGSLWIAKFPSVKDEWDVGRREYETSVLARKAGLNVPETKAQKLSKSGTTFFSKRFDRVGPVRIHYASAMTMLGARDGEDGTDDHLSNHGFLLTPKGWRLAPMFDVNPNPDGGPHAIDLGDLVEDAPYYRLTRDEARERYAFVRDVVGC